MMSVLVFVPGAVLSIYPLTLCFFVTHPFTPVFALFLFAPFALLLVHFAPVCLCHAFTPVLLYVNSFIFAFPRFRVCHYGALLC